MENRKNELIFSVFNNNKSGVKSTENYIRKHFADEYEKILEFTLNKNNNLSWLEYLYNYINELDNLPTCKTCGGLVKFTNLRKGYREYCSNLCKNKSTLINDKKKITYMLKYGVDNPSKAKIIKEKIKEKNCVNGVWYVQTDEYLIKKKKTNIERYGVDSFSKTNEFREKCITTNIKKYGTDSYNKTIESKKRVKENNMNKYGVEYYLLTKEFKEKSKISCLNKYGVEHHTKTDEYKNKMKNYCRKKYGTDYYMQTEEFKDKIYNTMLEKYGEIWINHAPKYNINSIIYLDMISEKLNIPIQHALNGGEKKFIRYWVDGYIEKYNICIEWDEKHHNGTKQKEKDIKKELFIRDKFNSKFIRINEKSFFDNIENGINDICNLIMQYTISE